MPKSWTSKNTSKRGFFNIEKQSLFNAFGYAFGYTKMWSLSTIFSDHYPNRVEPRVKSTSFRSCLSQGIAVFFLGLLYSSIQKFKKSPDFGDLVHLCSPDIQWCLLNPKRPSWISYLEVIWSSPNKKISRWCPSPVMFVEAQKAQLDQLVPPSRRHGTEAGAWKSSAARGKCLAMAETWTLNLEIVTVV